MRFVLTSVLLSLSVSLTACHNDPDSYSGLPGAHQQALIGLKKSGLQVVQQGDRVTIIIPSIDYFDPQKELLLEGKGHDLTKLANFVASYKNSPVRVIGFSNNVGASVNQFNRSQNQAEIVASFLWRAGVPLAQTTTQILGSSSIGEVASNATSTGRSANERVEIWIN